MKARLIRISLVLIAMFLSAIFRTRALSQVNGPELRVRNVMFDFGTLTVNQTATLSTWIRNAGMAELVIDSLVFAENVLGAFSISDSLTTRFLLPSDSVQLTVRFAPTQVLFYGGYLVIYSNSLSSPDTIFTGGAVTASQLPAPFYLYRETYAMISIPGVLKNRDIRSTLSNSLGPYATQLWRIFYWKTDRYLELPEFSPGDSLFFKPGIAFWLITRDTVEIVLQNVSSTPVLDYSGPWPRQVDYPIPLSPGWNMIASPFAYPVSWGQILGSNLVQSPVRWDGWQYGYNQTVLYPWQGYFVYNPTGAPVTLQVPPFSSVPKTERHTLSEKEFVLEIQARGLRSGLKDNQNAVGMLESAADGFDKKDYLEAPPIGDYLQLSILDGRNRFAGNFKAVSSAGARWDLSLSTTGKQEAVELVFEGISSLQKDFLIWLLDQDRECMIPVQQGKAQLDVQDAGKVRHLLLIVGTKKFAEQNSRAIPLVPYSFALLPNFPNPFNPTTRIEYQLAEKSPVRLEILNVLGRRVRFWMEADRPAGKYQVVWDGKDEIGMPAGSGVYICRISAGSFTASRKMLLIR